MATNFCKIGPKHIKIGFPTLYLSLFLPPSPRPALVEPILSKSGVGTKFIAIVSGNKYRSLMNRTRDYHPAPFKYVKIIQMKQREQRYVKLEQCSMNIPFITGPCFLATS